MTSRTTLLIAMGALALAGGAATGQEATGSPGAARATLIDASGASVGTATLSETPAGLLIRAVVEGIEPGPHGVHIHETGRCEASGGFESAGGHYNPRGADHGYEAKGGPHAGDLPNQTADADGRMVVEVFTPALSLTGGDAPLVDDDGSALVIHATADDYRSQPAGKAGDRVACGVIEQG